MAIISRASSCIGHMVPSGAGGLEEAGIMALAASEETGIMALAAADLAVLATVDTSAAPSTSDCSVASVMRGAPTQQQQLSLPLQLQASVVGFVGAQHGPLLAAPAPRGNGGTWASFSMGLATGDEPSADRCAGEGGRSQLLAACSWADRP